MSPRRVRAVGIKLMKSQQLFGGDIRGVLEVAKICDRMGVDEIHVSDHVLMTGEGHRGRAGFPYPLDWDGWYEPLEMLAAIAAVTERVRLSSHVIIAPLRPAVLLAKQLATLDVLSGGRVDIGLGVGWQSQEFAAAGVPFDRRLTRLVEQVEACRALWGESPARYEGSTVSFAEAYSLPRPVQGANLPISFGLPAGPRAFAEIARLGVGYCPAYHVGSNLAENVAAAREAYREAGRDPRSLKVTSEMTMEPPLTEDGRVNWVDAFAEGQAVIDSDVDVLLTHLVPHCQTADEIEPFIERLLELREPIAQ
jgi:probable F420-dependent oxidoreductase